MMRCSDSSSRALFIVALRPILRRGCIVYRRAASRHLLCCSQFSCAARAHSMRRCAISKAGSAHWAACVLLSRHRSARWTRPFLPTLQARLDEEPTDELWEVMDAMGEIFSMPELMRVTEGDEIIARHWNADNLGEYWELDDDEQLAVDLDGLPADSARPAENERGSGYGEVTRAGGVDPV